MKKIVCGVLALAMVWALAGCANKDATDLSKQMVQTLQEKGTVSFALSMRKTRFTVPSRVPVTESAQVTSGVVEITGAFGADMKVSAPLNSYNESTYTTYVPGTPSVPQPYGPTIGGRSGGNEERTSRSDHSSTPVYMQNNTLYYTTRHGSYQAGLSSQALYKSLTAFTVAEGSITNLSLGGSALNINPDNPKTTVRFDIVDGGELATQINALFCTLFPDTIKGLSGMACTLVLDKNGLPESLTLEGTSAFGDAGGSYRIVLDDFQYGGNLAPTFPDNLTSFPTR